MRLWSLHPRYLDAKGLVALWREGLLAQHVLLGRTKGYRHHPQLERFRACRDPVSAIATYLAVMADEATRRGYAFDVDKLARKRTRMKQNVTRGQVAFEWVHLQRKLKTRDPERYRAQEALVRPQVHPLFTVVPGPIAGWERL